MELESFFVEYRLNGTNDLAEIKPCCQEENVFYYDVSINNQFQFTITPETKDGEQTRWRLALKNSDKQVDPELVQLIGDQIERYHLA